MKCDNATRVNRKSGVAEWRDLQFRGPLLEMFFDRWRDLRCALRPSRIHEEHPAHGTSRNVCLVDASTAAWVKGMAKVFPLYQYGNWSKK
jgi:hypothetical protein